MSRPCIRCQKILPADNYNECHYRNNVCYHCYCFEFFTATSYIEKDEKGNYTYISDYALLFAHLFCTRQHQSRTGVQFHPELTACLNDEKFTSIANDMMEYMKKNDLVVLDEILIKKCIDCQCDLRSNKNGIIDVQHCSIIFNNNTQERVYRCHLCYVTDQLNRYKKNRDMHTMILLTMTSYFFDLERLRKNLPINSCGEYAELLDIKKYPQVYRGMLLIKKDYDTAKTLVQQWARDYWTQIKDSFVPSATLKKYECTHPNFEVTGDYHFSVSDYLGGNFISVSRDRDRFFLTLEIHNERVSLTGTNGSVADIKEAFGSMKLKDEGSEPLRKRLRTR